MWVHGTVRMLGRGGEAGAGGICGGVGGGRSWRKSRMISWVGSIGLSSSEVQGGEVDLWSFKEILGLDTSRWATADGCEGGLVGDVETQ